MTNGSVETSQAGIALLRAIVITLAPGWEIFIEEEENCEV